MLLIFLFLSYHLFINKSYSGSFTLNAGQYNFYLYGAQGGRAFDFCTLSGYGGKGAYVSGTLKITGTGTTFHAFVGGMGGFEKCSGPNSGGFNGGGKSGIDTPTGDESDDASGGGGGATDVRIYNSNTENRIIVAAGGSGAGCTCNGAPGGTLQGYYAIEHNQYAPSQLVTQTLGMANGVGQDGKDSEYTSGGGAGGGWRGGVSTPEDKLDPTVFYNMSYVAVAHSGSSYISGYPGCTKTQNVVFTNGNMQAGVKEGDGSLEIISNYLCSSNCTDCSSSSVCNQCQNGFYLYTDKKICTSSCTSGYVLSNSLCYPCLASGCASCSSPSIKTCQKCKLLYYYYDGYCYTKCSTLNTNGKYFGIDKANKVCKQCSDANCIRCDSDYSKCTKCTNKYHLVSGKCVHDPTPVFTMSKTFTKSSVFTSSSTFTQSAKFTKSNTFSNSALFSKSNKFSLSTIFTLSQYFSESEVFTKSHQFTKSDSFSQSDIFSQSNDFSKSFVFSNSKPFTSSFLFTKSELFSSSDVFSSTSDFTQTSYFTQTKEFSKSSSFSPSSTFSSSKLFSQSNDFTASDVFSLTDLFSHSHFFSESQTFVPQIIMNPKKKKSPIIVIGIPIIIVALLVLTIFLILFIIFWKRKKDEETEKNERKNVETDLINEQTPSSENELYKPSSDTNDRDLNFWL